MNGTSTSPTDLLLHTRAVLAGDHTIPRSQVPRAAAILARQALEDTVNLLSGDQLDQASMRSRLIIMRVLGDRVAAELATTAWSGLSRACHHHAYELAPTVAEVGRLVDQVSTLVERNAQCDGTPSDDHRHSQ